jgi:hypothetical protein
MQQQQWGQARGRDALPMDSLSEESGHCWPKALHWFNCDARILYSEWPLIVLSSPHELTAIAMISFFDAHNKSKNYIHHRI